MIALVIILVCAIGYAFIRAKHDSFLKGGKWKTWAFVEGVLWAAVVVGLTLAAFDMKWWYGLTLGPVFAFVFWLVFDCAVGYQFADSIWYLGSGKFDTKMKNSFKYDLQIFGWRSGSFIFVLFKLFWLVFFTLAYISLL